MLAIFQCTHPEAHALLLNCDFGVQRATSQTIEETLNRSTKTKGGIVGFSLRKGAVHRRMITALSRASLVESDGK